MQERKTNGIGYYAGGWPLDSRKATLVFIHGAGGSGNVWQEQVRGLSAHVNTVALDLPGRGRTNGEGQQEIADYAEIVVKFINGIDAPDPILCGFSMGGAIVQQMLLDYPKRIKAGILIGTGARMKVAPAFFETIARDYSGFVDWLCKICVSRKTDPHKVHPFREDLLGCRPEVTMGDFRACDRFDAADQIPAIEAPVLVVTSEEDKLTPPEAGAFLEKNIKNASRMHVMGAGHLVPLEKPEETNRVILKFLETTGLL